MNTRKVITVAAGATATAAAALTTTSYIITKSLIGMALDRKPLRYAGRSKRRIAGTAGMEGLIEKQKAAADALKAVGLKEISIRARDGETLVGHLYHTPNARRTLIAMHGWRSSYASDFGMIAPFWHGEACNVLYAEQRGQNNSGGKYMSFGLIERYDCLDWINFINTTDLSNLPIYLGGISMGATTVLMATGSPLPDNVCGVIDDCGFTSMHAIWKHVVRNNLHLGYGGVRSLVADRMCKKRIHMGTKDYSTLEAMKHCRVPVLFIHGSDDTFVPIQMTYDNYKACSAEKRLLVVPGAQHGLSYVIDREGYEAAVREFFHSFDRKIQTKYA